MFERIRTRSGDRSSARACALLSIGLRLGTFAPAPAVDAGTRSATVVEGALADALAVDLNGDRLLDLAEARSSGLTVRWGTADGVFAETATSIAANVGANRLAAA